jgi:hypothetical protein
VSIGSAPEIGKKFSTGRKSAQEVRDGIAALNTYYAKAADGGIVHYPPRYPNGVRESAHEADVVLVFGNPNTQDQNESVPESTSST